MPITTTTTAVTPQQLAERDERVFPSYPQVARYFPAVSIEDARNRLGRTIERGDGSGLIIGGPGTGKSLLLQILAAQYHDRFDVVLPACARLCTRRALLQAVLFELGLPYRLRDEGDLRLSLLDHLLSREECPAGLLLLVDEAQTLSPALLDELRVLTNLVRGGMPRVRLILAGSSALEECFAHPELESFSQRLSARCYLGPFGREETVQYVRAQVAACGASPDQLFGTDAIEAIFEATDGVPRLINQLCDRALVQAGTTNRTRIDRQIIQAAWADIQQLPAPWETPAPTTAPPAPLQVVEFGSLEDDHAEIPKASNEPSIAERWDEEEVAATDPTELDCEDEVLERSTTTAITAAADVEQYESVNPFTEKFDEEEVVLDNFAGWEDMFRREAPRVQNRRDPEFAALVQSAISTHSIGSAVVSASTGAPFQNLSASSHECETTEPETHAAKTANNTEVADWPPLRLARISDAVFSSHADDTTAADFEREFQSRSQYNAEQDAYTPWSRSDSSHDVYMTDVSEANGEEPVLIVEDDNPAPNSPVRREEYRNLFSRLRGG